MELILLEMDLRMDRFLGKKKKVFNSCSAEHFNFETCIRPVSGGTPGWLND